MWNFSSLRNLNPDSYVYIYGLGISGLSASKALSDSNIDFFAWDDDPEKRQNYQYDILEPEHCDFSKVSYVILSPGISHETQLVRNAKKHGSKIICDIELFLQEKKAPFTIGVTGTNGKSTVCKLLSHILSQNPSRKVQVLGNIGKPVLSLNSESDINIVEMSSYHLDLCSQQSIENGLDIRILTNISETHLDRYGSFDEYVKSKMSMLSTQNLAKDSIKGVISIDSDVMLSKYESIKDLPGHFIIPTSQQKCLKNGISILNGVIHDNGAPVGTIKNSTSVLPINIAIAYAACKLMNIPSHEIINSISNFIPLPHRLQNIPTDMLNGIKFINDSKSTNSAALQVALNVNKDKNIYLIAGGKIQDKSFHNIDFENVKRVFLIGRSCKELSFALNHKCIDYKVCINLKNAVNSAIEDALVAGSSSNNVILFSPGAASTDQWKNFEQRGDAFVEICMAAANSQSFSS